MLKKSYLTLLTSFVFALNVWADSTWKNSFALGQKEEWYGSEEAIRIAENVLLYQCNSGGWPKNIEMQDSISEEWKQIVLNAKDQPSCFDNGATTTEMRFLAKVYKHIPDSRYIEAFNRALDCILEAQSLCGSGWPQYWPARGGGSYSDFITFNDNLVVNILKMLRDVVNNSGDFDSITNAETRRISQECFDKGLQCILDCQIKNDQGELTVWCAQHDPTTLLPAVARNYEMPSYSGGESADILTFLMSIKNPSEAIINAVESGVKWFDENVLEDKAIEKFTNEAGEDDVRMIDAPGKRIWARFTQIDGEIGRRTYEALFQYLEQYGSTRSYTINGKTVQYRDVDNARNSYDATRGNHPIYCPKNQNAGCSYRFAYNFNDSEPIIDKNGAELPTSLNTYDRTSYSFASNFGDKIYPAYEKWKQTSHNTKPDTSTPFGWGTCSSPEGKQYQLSGGCWQSLPTITTLYASGSDDRQAILDAISFYDIVLLDGSKGDFIISKTMPLHDLKNKSILGLNNARLCTQWYITPELKQKMIDAKLDTLPDDRDGGVLSNGKSIYDASEFYTRQMLIDYTGDPEETYRKSGIFSLNTTNENIIIRNLTFVGPGSLDVSGNDLISNYGGTHVWIDHCEFIDGMDGNLDSGKREGSDQYVTYSWNKFRYTERSFVHAFSNGVGWDRGYLQYITYAYNIWGEGCQHRMPQADHVKMHLLNNYYNCPDDSICIFINGPSETLIEGCYAEEGMNNIFLPGGQEDMFYVTRYNIGFGDYDYAKNTDRKIEMPYSYYLMESSGIPAILSEEKGAGATLSAEDFNLPKEQNTIAYLIGKDETFAAGTTIKRPNISLTFSEEGGADFYNSVAYMADSIFTHYTPGNGVNGDKSGGTFYTLRPELDGTITIAVKHNLKKPLYIQEDGVALPDYNGITFDETHSDKYRITFEAKGGSTYKIYCTGSKLGFYGFIYEKKEATDISDVQIVRQHFTPGIYTIDGKKILTPGKGLHIIDGKKVLWK